MAPLVAMLLVASSCFATTAANIRVTATVLPYMNFNSTQHGTTYQVRSDDLKRGYVDLPQVMTVTVKTNVNREVTFVVSDWRGSNITVRDLNRVNFDGNSFTLNTADYQPGSAISMTIDSRIVLPADTREGVYPFSIVVTPGI